MAAEIPAWVRDAIAARGLSIDEARQRLHSCLARIAKVRREVDLKDVEMLQAWPFSARLARSLVVEGTPIGGGLYAATLDGWFVTVAKQPNNAPPLRRGFES